MVWANTFNRNGRGMYDKVSFRLNFQRDRVIEHWKRDIIVFCATVNECQIINEAITID